MTPEDLQTFDDLSTRWNETAFKRDALFPAAFNGSTEYWNRSQPALNILKADKEEIHEAVEAFIELYFPYFNK